LISGENIKIFKNNSFPFKQKKSYEQIENIFVTLLKENSIINEEIWKIETENVILKETFLQVLNFLEIFKKDYSNDNVNFQIYLGIIPRTFSKIKICI
jgi:hypothetical protein